MLIKWPLILLTGHSLGRLGLGLSEKLRPIIVIAIGWHSESSLVSLRDNKNKQPL